jgi:hypothetical protein
MGSFDEENQRTKISRYCPFKILKLVGIYVLLIDLKDRMKDKNPLPISQSKKKDMTCQENLRVK